MNIFNRLMMGLCLSLLAFSARAQPPHADLRAALEHLETGTALLEERDPQSEQVLEEAAAMLQAVIEDHGLQTPGVYHALGNAYMLAGEPGHAVLAYRKGEQIDPTDRRLSESLEHARSQIPVDVTPDTGNRLWSWSMIWRGRVPRPALWLGFTSLFTLGWLACAARVLRLAPRPAAVAGIWCIGLSLLPLALLAGEWYRFQGSTDAVVTQENIIARTGPDDEIYDPVFAEPLTQGVEASLVETRGSWSLMELADGTEFWIPTEAHQLVNP